VRDSERESVKFVFVCEREGQGESNTSAAKPGISVLIYIYKIPHAQMHAHKYTANE
jgi:hypothetical protein